MGNKYSHTSEDIEWAMVGRSNDLQKLISLIEESRQVNITGLKKIGKSRVMMELAKRMNADDQGRYFVLFVDFDNVYIQDHSALYELIMDANEALDKSKARKELNGNDVGIAEKDPDSKPFEMIKKCIERLIQSIKRFSECSKCRQHVVLFLDNVEKLMDSDIKDIFLNSVSQIIKRSTGTKCVLASSIKPCFLKKNVIQYQLQKLNTEEIIELLFEITENRDGVYQRSETCTEVDGRQYWFSFSKEMKIFKPENQIYIKIIAKLCEGLPLAADVSGKAFCLSFSENLLLAYYSIHVFGKYVYSHLLHVIY
jgi:AAA+ ATPase superfamily predicted ATPase